MLHDVPTYGIAIGEEAYARAAGLLAAIWRTGLAFGVRAGDWDRAGFELAGGCLHVCHLPGLRRAGRS